MKICNRKEAIFSDFKWYHLSSISSYLDFSGIEDVQTCWKLFLLLCKGRRKYFVTEISVVGSVVA
jgi:hypothetical protein